MNSKSVSGIAFVLGVVVGLIIGVTIKPGDRYQLLPAGDFGYLVWRLEKATGKTMLLGPNGQPVNPAK